MPLKLMSSLFKRYENNAFKKASLVCFLILFVVLSTSLIGGSIFFVLTLDMEYGIEIFLDILSFWVYPYSTMSFIPEPNAISVPLFPTYIVSDSLFKLSISVVILYVWLSFTFHYWNNNKRKVKIILIFTALYLCYWNIIVWFGVIFSGF